MKRFVRRILKKARLYYYWHNWSARRKYAQQLVAWELDGRPVPPPHLVKQRTLLTYSMKYGLNTLVETGYIHR